MSPRTPNQTPSLRADAEANRERIIAAARSLFAERGIDVTMDEVARRAGVGPATLYRRFPTRADLLAGAFEEKMWMFADGARRALDDPDPWHGFCQFIAYLTSLQSSDLGFNEVLTMTFPTVPGFETARDDAYKAIVELIAKTQRAGALRPDFVAEDLIVTLLAHAGVIAAAGRVAPRSGPRLMGYLVQAFAAPAKDVLPPPPTYREITKVFLRLSNSETETTS